MRARKIDNNQREIVEVLRSIPGVTVSCNHDDILVGRNGVTYWYEIKGSRSTKIQKSQVSLKNNWSGHYKIVYSVDDILIDMGIVNGKRIRNKEHPGELDP